MLTVTKAWTMQTLSLVELDELGIAVKRARVESTIKVSAALSGLREKNLVK